MRISACEVVIEIVWTESPPMSVENAEEVRDLALAHFKKIKKKTQKRFVDSPFVFQKFWEVSLDQDTVKTKSNPESGFTNRERFCRANRRKGHLGRFWKPKCPQCPRRSLHWFSKTWSFWTKWHSRTPDSGNPNAPSDPDSACTGFKKHCISGQDSACLDTNVP